MHPMKKLLTFSFLLLECLIALATPAQGATPAFQDHAQIKKAVSTFVQQQTAALPGKATYKVEEIDQRISLTECPRLEVFLPPGSRLIGKTSVGVRCSGKNSWKIFVPVQIKLSLDLLVSARQLSTGHTLLEEDLASQTTEISRTTGFTDRKQVLGKVLRYSISAGQILREDMLRLPYSVSQGQSIQMIVQGRGFSIRSAGVALNNASEGQTVQIRTSSGRVISGIAAASGVVQVEP